MKTMVKLVMLLAVLVICMPAQGEILIYSKLYKCWWADSADLENWNIESWTQKGFLVLDVDYDPNGEPNEIIDMEHVEYRKDGRDKWYWHYDEDYIFERIEVGGGVIWVLEYINATDTTSAEIIILKGKPVDMNIGLGGNAQREVVHVLNGYVLYLDIGMGVEKEMCTMSLRLNGKLTRLANRPNGCDQEFYCALFGAAIGWLQNKGYREIE